MLCEEIGERRDRGQISPLLAVVMSKAAEDVCRAHLDAYRRGENQTTPVQAAEHEARAALDQLAAELRPRA